MCVVLYDFYKCKRNITQLEIIIILEFFQFLYWDDLLFNHLFNHIAFLQNRVEWIYKHHQISPTITLYFKRYIFVTPQFLHPLVIFPWNISFIFFACLYKNLFTLIRYQILGIPFPLFLCRIWSLGLYLKLIFVIFLLFSLSRYACLWPRLFQFFNLFINRFFLFHFQKFFIAHYFFD